MSEGLPAPPAAAEGVFFSGQDLRVVLRLFEADPDLFVTFTGRSGRPHAGGFGEAFFLKRRLSAVHFISNWNHWWQTAEVEAAVAQLRAAGILDNRRHLRLYGSSMGGYAALSRSALFQPTEILAISPQYSIDAAVVPFEKRWRRYARAVTFSHDDMARGLDRRARILYVVDPLFRADAQHLQLLQRLRPVEVVAISLAEHNTVRALEELGLGTRLVAEVAGGAFSPAALRRDYRACRAGSCLVWYGLARALLERGRSGLALPAASLAAHLVTLGGRMRDPTLQMEILLLALQLSCEAGDAATARRWLGAIEARMPSPPTLAMARLRVALAEGAAATAQAEVPALLAKGQEQDAWAVAYAALLAAGETEKAAALLRGREKSEAPVLHCAAGRHMLGQGDAAAALPLLRRAFQAEPQDTEIRTWLVEAEFATGHDKPARRLIRRAVGRVPASPGTQDRQVAQLRRLGDEAGAERLLRRHAWLRDLQARLLAALPMVDAAQPAASVQALLARLRQGG